MGKGYEVVDAAVVVESAGPRWGVRVLAAGAEGIRREVDAGLVVEVGRARVRVKAVRSARQVAEVIAALGGEPDPDGRGVRRWSRSTCCRTV